MLPYISASSEAVLDVAVIDADRVVVVMGLSSTFGSPNTILAYEPVETPLTRRPGFIQTQLLISFKEILEFYIRIRAMICLDLSVHD